jgi:hypothetical protein
VTQLLVAALSNVGKLYITVEGAASTHINNAISAKAAILEGLLGEPYTLAPPCKVVASLQAHLTLTHLATARLEHCWAMHQLDHAIAQVSAT